jgi:hypothetical protein
MGDEYHSFDLHSLPVIASHVSHISPQCPPLYAQFGESFIPPWFHCVRSPGREEPAGWIVGDNSCSFQTRLFVHDCRKLVAMTFSSWRHRSPADRCISDEWWSHDHQACACASPGNFANNQMWFCKQITFYYESTYTVQLPNECMLPFGYTIKIRHRCTIQMKTITPSPTAW